MFQYICNESAEARSRCYYVVTNPGKMNCVQDDDDASTTIQNELNVLGFKRPLSRAFIQEFVEKDYKLLEQYGSNLFKSQSRRLIINNRHTIHVQG